MVMTDPILDAGGCHLAHRVSWLDRGYWESGCWKRDIPARWEDSACSLVGTGQGFVMEFFREHMVSRKGKD